MRSSLLDSYPHRIFYSLRIQIKEDKLEEIYTTHSAEEKCKQKLGRELAAKKPL